MVKQNHLFEEQNVDDDYIFITFSDTADDITTMEQIQGDWWILKGQNCGQDEVWNGGYDAYPCQKVSQEID